MSESSKAAIEYGTLWYYGANGERKSAGPNEMKIQAHIDGARALLDWAKSKQIYGINIAGNPTPFGTVNLSDLEAYFAEEKK